MSVRTICSCPWLRSDENDGGRPVPRARWSAGPDPPVRGTGVDQ